MKKEGIKGSVVAAALVLGLVTAPTPVKAGWLSDTWDSFTDRVENLFDEAQDAVEDVIDDVILQPVEDGIVYLLEHGAGKGADYLIGLMLQLDSLDGHVAFGLMVDLMQNKNIITDDILIAMMKNENMVSLIGKLIAEEDTQARAEEFFTVAMQRMLPIMMDPSFDVNIISEIPTEAFVMFSSLGSIEDNDDALEKAWEGMLKSAMSDPQTAGRMFELLGKVSPAYKKAMLDFMFLAIDANGIQHIAQSVNFNQAMIEGFATMMENDPQAAQQLLQGLMPMLLTFDDQGNMTGMTPYGARFMTVLGTKMITCQDPAATALGMAFGQMMPGVVPPAINEDYACNRVEDAENIAHLNNVEITYIDSDNDGVPDFMDRYPGIDNRADIDNDGIPNDADDDMDGDDIANGADADANGDGQIDTGKADTDGDGIDNASDNDIDGDGIDNDSDDDIDGDGIANDADADVNGDGIVDNGPDKDGDGINDAHDNDIDGDGIVNDADADADGDGQTDDGVQDEDGDGIIDGIVVDNGKIVETIVYFYGTDGILRDKNNQEVVNRDYSNDANHITNVTVMMPGNKSVVIQVDMDGIHTDDQGNKMIVSDMLDDKGSRFIISMTTDGFGKVFIGNADGGFEMTGYLQGMKENEELVFSVSKTQDGKLAGKTTIMPKDKALAFGSSVFKQ